jgi:hypothetical protein
MKTMDLPPQLVPEIDSAPVSPKGRTYGTFCAGMLFSAPRCELRPFLTKGEP